jgi:hypothetical protein
MWQHKSGEDEGQDDRLQADEGDERVRRPWLRFFGRIIQLFDISQRLGHQMRNFDTGRVQGHVSDD